MKTLRRREFSGSSLPDEFLVRRDGQERHRKFDLARRAERIRDKRIYAFLPDGAPVFNFAPASVTVLQLNLT